jgi:RNA polymerase sigma-70 factor (ECF subfamily)
MDGSLQAVTNLSDGVTVLPIGAPEATEDISTDGAIRAAVSSGDLRRAAALCAQKYGAPIGRLCMAMLGSQSEAEELAQETLLAALVNLESCVEGNYRAWLLGIARKKCLKTLERRRVHHAKLFLVPGAEDAASADHFLQLKQRADRARAALEQIKPTEREALLLRYVGALSFKGIGEACGVPEAAARKRVSRGLCRLRDVLAKSEEL